MTFKYKVRPYENEEGEFTDYVPGDTLTIKQRFVDNATTDESLREFRSIAIVDNQGQTLVIHHVKKDVFDEYFIPLDIDLYYYKKSTLDAATQALDLFLNRQIDHLTSSLNKKHEENDYIRNDFFNKSFQYQMTKKKTLSEIWWIWYALPLGVAFIVLGIININHLGILLLPIGLVLWVPGLLVHYQYYRDNKDLKVGLSKGQEIIEITTPTVKKTLKKQDIKEILKVDGGRLNRFGWGQYGFTRIEFKSGEILYLTSLMIDQLFIEEKFIGHNIKILKTGTLVPTLDGSTRL